jgi:predicted nucleic acid-binding protein
LADTSGLYALIVARDADHATAEAIQKRLVAERRELIATNFVLAELHALLLARVGRQRALTAILELLGGRMGILRVGENEERRALEILQTYDDKDFTLVDATSFAVMERLGVTLAFTFDHHFVQFGFRALGLEL